MLLVAFLFAASASAASVAPRVVLVAPDGAELARKVRAEAEHVGISIASERGPSPGDGELLRRHGAVGVVELVSPERVRIHVAPSGDHGAYDTSIERAPADGDGFAVRVVEQVRGRLVELRILVPESEAVRDAERPADPTPPRDTVSSRPGVDRPDARQRASVHSPTLGLAVGGAGTAAVGGLGVTPGVALGLRLEPTSRWAATLRALLPVAENDLVAREGEASAQISLFLAELGYRLAPNARVEPELGPGAGLVVLALEAEANAPREAHTDDVVASVYFLHAGASFKTTSWLRLRAAVRGGMSAPRPVLRFDEREVATWGRGFFSGTLEAEFQLPLSGAEATP
jgi:hypothetical protein